MSEILARVLIVDDEPQIRRFLRTSLSAQNCTVIEAATAQEGLLRATTERPDIIILDLGLPDRDGMQVIREIRSWSKTPIIVLSVRGREQDKIAALDAGAEDYVTKPFGMGELVARIRAVLRSRIGHDAGEPVFVTGGLCIDRVKRLVQVDGNEIKLTPTEYELLCLLVENAGKVVTHDHLLREIWGPTDMDQTHYLRVYIGQIRHKIEPDPAQPQYIITEPGVGYRLRAE